MYVSLMIDNTRIKVLSLKGRKVRHWQTQSIEDGLVKDGLILQPEAIGNAVAALLKSLNMPRDRVILSLGGMSYTYRFLTLPKLPASRMEEAILRAIKKELSFPLEQLYLSWQKVSSEGAEVTYFVIGVPRNLIDAVAATLKYARVERYLLDIRPLALARAAGRSDAIIVNMEPDSYDVVFVTGGLPVILHTITPRTGGATLDDNVHRLSDEITKMAAFYQASHPGFRFDGTTSLIYTGESTGETAAGALLKTELEYPVESLVVPVQMPDDFPLQTYGANIGLALKRAQIKKSATESGEPFRDIDVNLFAGMKRQTTTRPAKKKSTTLRWGLILIVVLALLYPLYTATLDLRQENTALQEQIRLLNRDVTLAQIEQEQAAEKEETLAALLDESQSLLARRAEIADSGGVTIALVEKVTGTLPAGGDYTLLQVAADHVTVRGEADDEDLVVSFAEALQNSGFFTDVSILQILPGAEERVVFSIEMDTR